MDRENARNAVDGAVAQGLEAAVERLEADPDIWAAVLTGAGGVFSAGADLKLVSQGRSEEMFTKRGGFGGFVQLPRSKPVIAAVNSPALAGGCELALASDLIVASTDSRFGLPEVRWSLLAVAGDLVWLPQALPRRVATHMMMTGDPIGAERAYQLGMVCDLTEPGHSVEAALAIAERINSNAPLAVRRTLGILRRGSDQTSDETWREGRLAMRDLAMTSDYQEGPRAFVEKRPPVWQGK